MDLFTFLLQMWPKQTRQQEKLDDIRSSLPLRRYFLLNPVLFVSYRYIFLTSLFLFLSSMHVRRCWRSRGSLEVMKNYHLHIMFYYEQSVLVKTRHFLQMWPLMNGRSTFYHWMMTSSVWSCLNSSETTSW